MAEQQHHRRKRYKGTHPRTFQEKYKELQPEKYADTVEKVISKGGTPAGTHRPICVKEILDILHITPGETGLDATLGYGGHSLEMLKCLDHQGHLYALDVDPIELPRTKERLEKKGFGPEILTTNLTNFCHIDQIAAESGPFDFILADLGISSMQVDNPKRGFSFKMEGPLDLRLNPTKGISAAERLKDLSQEELEGMFVENSDEPYAAEISHAIIQELKKGHEISTTTQLQRVIQEALHFIPKADRGQAVKKSCQRCFQALRIDVNSEYEVLYDFLEKLPDALAPGGRAAILTFHSGEDRFVKKSFKKFYKKGVYSDIAPEPIRPSAKERNSNNRSRGTKLRWAVKS